MTKHGTRAVPEPESSAAAFALSGGMPSDVRQRLIADLEPRQGRHQGRRLLAAAEPTVPGSAGERIAHLALTALRDAFEHASEDSTPLALGRAFAVADAVVRARNRLHEAGAEAPRILVGVTAAVVEGRIVTIAQVPPHRAILIQDGRCYPLPGSEWAERGASDGDVEVEPHPLGSDGPVAPRLVRSAIGVDDLLILADSCLIDHLGQDGRRFGPGDRAIARDVHRTLTWMEGIAWRHGLDDVMGACLTLPFSDGTSTSQDRPRAPWLASPLAPGTLSSLSAVVTAAPAPTGGPVGREASVEHPLPTVDPAHAAAVNDTGNGEGSDSLDPSAPRDADQPGDEVMRGEDLATPGDRVTRQPRQVAFEAGPSDSSPSADDRDATIQSDQEVDLASPSPVSGESGSSIPGVIESGVGLATDEEVRAATLAAADAWWHSAASRSERAATSATGLGRWNRRGESSGRVPPTAHGGMATPVKAWVLAPGQVDDVESEVTTAPVTSRSPVIQSGGTTLPGRSGETIRVVTGPRGRAAFFPGGLSTLPPGPQRRRRIGSLTRLALVALALSVICGSSAVAHDRVTERTARAQESRDALAGLDSAIAAFEAGEDLGADGTTAKEALARAEQAGIAEETLASRRVRLRQLQDQASGAVRLGNVSRVGQIPVEITAGSKVPPRLVRAGQTLYLVANGLYEVSLTDSRLVAALAPGSEIDGRVVGPLTDGTWNTGGLVVTDGAAAYRLQGSDWTVRPLGDMPAPERQGPCATLDDGFYVLDSEDGTILRADVTADDGEMSAWTPIGQTPSLRGAKALVIDGRVHVLRVDGSIATLDAGKIVAERTLPVDPPVTDPVTMIGGLDTTVLWVLDRVGHELRVIRTDPTTGETRAFLFDTPIGNGDALRGITGMAVDEGSHTIHLISPDSLWRADLPVYIPAVAGRADG